jgi:hypothetical protein
MYKTPKADQFNISDLRAAADIIEEKTDKLTYLGFCAPGTINTAAASWSIMKIESSGIVKPIITSFKWAEGLAAFSHSWDNRAAYNYTFKNF